MNEGKNNVFRDLGVIALSVLIAIILLRTGILIGILASARELEILGSFIAGMFFTSVFTTAPAIVTLGELARVNSVILVALVGGVGAVVGDLIIFRFIRDRFSGHLMELLPRRGIGTKFRLLIKLKYFRWLTFLVGGLIIASPFPDELGVSLLGFSRMRMSRFVALSFFLNSVGIFVIGLIARML